MKSVIVLRKVIDKMLLPYQITLSDLEDEYPKDKDGVILVDGIPWFLYFYIPYSKEQIIIKKTKGWKPIMGLYTPSNLKRNWGEIKLLKNHKQLWANRNKIIHDAYERLD